MTVISEVHRLATSRLAAVMVAVALSGAPRLALPGDAAPGHRCCCPKQAVRRVCPCAARAGQSRGPREAPRPCHGVAPGGAGRGEPGPGPAPTWFRPGCGTPEAAVAPPSGIDAFLLPEPLTVAAPIAPERMTEPWRAPPDVPVEPETPPPIAAWAERS